MAKNLTSTLIVRLLDEVSAPARSAAQSLLGIGAAVNKAGQKVALSQRIGSAIERNNVALQNAQGQLVGAVAGFYALKNAIGGPVVIAAEFEASMNRVAAVSGATEVQLKTLTAQAMELGRSTQFTASQAADAQNFLAMAGFKTNEIIEALPGTLQLAASAQMDLGDAADIVSNVLTGYGKKVEELIGQERRCIELAAAFLIEQSGKAVGRRLLDSSLSKAGHAPAGPTETRQDIRLGRPYAGLYRLVEAGTAE